MLQPRDISAPQGGWFVFKSCGDVFAVLLAAWLAQEGNRAEACAGQLLGGRAAYNIISKLETILLVSLRVSRESG